MAIPSLQTHLWPRFDSEIKQIVYTGRTQAVRSVNTCCMQMYRMIGQRIFEKEQQSKERADYGKYLIKSIAKETEIIKDSMVLEFLALERKATCYAKDLENAIISHIADFMLEMGKDNESQASISQL